MEYKKLACGRCGKNAKEGKQIGDHCGQFHNGVDGMFCSGTINEYDDFDGAPVEIIARELKKCCESWDPKARLLGNLRAEDIARLCERVIPRVYIRYDFMDYSDYPEPPDPEISSDVEDRYKTSLVLFFKKHNITVTDKIANQFGILKT